MLSNSDRNTNSNKRVEYLLEEFDFLSEKEKTDFLSKAWEEFCTNFGDDILIRNKKLTICNDLMKCKSKSAYSKGYFNNHL